MVFRYMVFLATFRLCGHLGKVFPILNFGFMVISAILSILQGQNRGSYITECTRDNTTGCPMSFVSRANKHFVGRANKH